MQEPARPEPLVQAVDRIFRARLLLPAHGAGVPLRRVEIVDGDEGRLAAHGQPHVIGDKVGVDLLAEFVQLRPGIVGERQRHPRRLAQARHLHLEAELDLGGIDGAGYRRGGAVVRRGAQGQVALAAEQAGGRVHAIQPAPGR